jgi:hypothetical protein
LIAQGSEFPLRKPPGFHWDFFLLGITTFIAGLLGIPAPNGLIPQAPMHTAALVVMGRDKRDEETVVEGDGVRQIGEKVEQRVSNLVQGSICEFSSALTCIFELMLSRRPRTHDRAVPDRSGTDSEGCARWNVPLYGFVTEF